MSSTSAPIWSPKAQAPQGIGHQSRPVRPSTSMPRRPGFSHLETKLRLRAESIAQTGAIDLDQATGAQGLGFKSASWSPVAAGKVDCLYDNEETPGRNPMIYKK